MYCEFIRNMSHENQINFLINYFSPLSPSAKKKANIRGEVMAEQTRRAVINQRIRQLEILLDHNDDNKLRQWLKTKKMPWTKLYDDEGELIICQ